MVGKTRRGNGDKTGQQEPFNHSKTTRAARKLLPAAGTKTGSGGMDFKDMVKEFAAAVEAGDGTRLAGLFSEEGVYHDTFYGEFKGREAIRMMVEERFHRDGERYRWEFRDPVCDGKFGYARWIFSYTAKVAGAEGKRVVFEGFSCFELEGGEIRHYGEAINAGVGLVQMDFAPARMDKLFRRWATELKARPQAAPHLTG